MTPSSSGESLVVPTSETLKQEYFLNMAIQHEFPLTMIGPSGTGKTFITTGLINRLSTEKFINNIVNFSARTNVNYTQGIFIPNFELSRSESVFRALIRNRSKFVRLNFLRKLRGLSLSFEEKGAAL